MPTKVKVKTYSRPWGYYGKPQNPPIGGGATSIIARSEAFNNHYGYDYISYPAGKKAEFHECDHLSYLRPKYGTAFRQEIRVTDPYEIVQSDNHIASFVKSGGYDPVVADKRYPNDPGIQKVKQTALVPSHMLREISLRGCALRLPSFKSEVSLINFLLELKDLRKMLLQCKKFAEYVDKVTSVARGENSVKTLKVSNKDLASNYLGGEFGWLPFARDVVGIARAIGTIRSRLKKFIKEQHQVKVGKYSKSLSNMFFSSVSQEGDNIYVGPSVRNDLPDMYAFISGGTEQIAVRNRRVVFTIKYSYWIPEMTDFQVKLRALCSVLGLEWNPKIIWDAIPWSFLIDWCVDVGDLLEKQLAKPVFPISLRVHEIMVSETHHFSYKRMVNVPYVWDPPNAGAGVTLMTTSKGKIVRRYKNKFITEAECIKMPWRGDPGAPRPRQLACFLALLVTNAKAVKKRKPRPPSKARMPSKHGSWIRTRGR
jgi:hypothetical protein